MPGRPTQTSEGCYVLGGKDTADEPLHVVAYRQRHDFNVSNDYLSVPLPPVQPNGYRVVRLRYVTLSYRNTLNVTVRVGLTLQNVAGTGQLLPLATFQTDATAYLSRQRIDDAAYIWAPDLDAATAHLPLTIMTDAGAGVLEIALTFAGHGATDDYAVQVELETWVRTP